MENDRERERGRERGRERERERERNAGHKHMPEKLKDTEQGE